MSTKVQETIKEISGLTIHEAQQVINLKTLESIEKLNDGIENLNKTIKISNEQSEELEKSNQRLQVAMFCLTLFTTIMTVFPISKAILEEVGMSGLKLIYSSSITTSIVTILISIFIGKQIKKWR